MPLGRCSARCIDCIHTSATQQYKVGAILSRYGVILSGPIDFLLLSVVMNLATSCTAIGGMQKVLAFWSLLWQNSFSVEEHSYSFRTSVSCLYKVSFSTNGRKCLLKESGVMLSGPIDLKKKLLL